MVVGKLWTSPEILRENFPPPRGTQRGDVYSFSIICVEVCSLVSGDRYVYSFSIICVELCSLVSGGKYVYSFSIIAFEIMMRSEPYSFDHMTARGLSARYVTLLYAYTQGCCP